MRATGGILGIFLALCLTNPVHAHATLVSTDPGDGSVVMQAPKMVQLRFNEAVALAAIHLIDADGRTREVTARAVDQSVLISVPADLPNGTQVVSYRVVSQDGHPIGGSIAFSIGAPSAAVTAPDRGGSLATLIWLARIGVYVGLFAGVGGVFFAIWIGQAPANGSIVVGSLYVGLASATASLGLQGIDLLGMQPVSMLTLVPWKAALGTSLGPSLLIAVAAMLLARAAWRSRSMRIGSALAALSFVGAGSALAASGHAATASPQWLTRTSMLLHGMCVTYWVGALVPLATLARRRSDTLPSVLTRFSAAAVPVVGMLALTGLALTWIQLGGVSALIDTEYGILLSIKLALVSLMLTLAAINRYWLTPVLTADRTRARPLLKSVLAECLLALVILGIVAGWRFTPPPRALAAAADAPLSIHVHTDSAMLQVLIAPGKVGADDFVLQLMTGDFRPLSAKEVTMTLSLPTREIEALERKAALGPDGNWHVRNVPLPVPGRWHMRVDALITDFQKVTLEDDFELR